MYIMTYICTLEEFEYWGQARYNYNKIVDAGLGEEFIDYLDELYPDGIRANTLNDILSYDDDFVEEFLKEYKAQDED